MSPNAHLLALAFAAALPSSVAATLPACVGAPVDPATLPTVFQKEIDATAPFVLQVASIVQPPGWNVPLAFIARDAAGKLLAVNPTLVAVPGATLHFRMENCLTLADIALIKGYNPLDAALPRTQIPGEFGTLQAAQMQPTGFANVHTHGLHGAPTAGNTQTVAGDEVLATFLSPFATPSSDPLIGSQQEYRIAIPANQDPGLYWYHPHLHGEAQPQVFLGLTGAIVVVPRHAHDPSGHAAIAAELTAHSDPSLHPAVFVVRDYSVEHFPTGASVAALAVRRHPRTHRVHFLAGSEKSASRSTVASSQPEDTDPRCVLFRAPGTQTPCLPDEVTNPAPEPSSLSTLVTVNGRITETPSGSGPDSLAFQPLILSANDPVLRVLNASANTYLRLALSAAPLHTVALATASAQNPPVVHLTQLRRDGAPVRTSLRGVDTILLPPAGRAEFQAAVASSAPLSLVSQFYDTGPAGDLVPPRTLVSFAPASASVSRSLTTTAIAAPELSTRFQNAYKPAASKDTHRAFAFFEQDRNCPSPPPGQPDPDCGTTFYLLDITTSVFGVAGQKSSVTQAVPFAMPMTAGGSPSRDLFDPHGRFKAATPSIQVALKGAHEADEEWEIYNFTGEAHAFHIHQLGFHVKESCSPRFLSAHSLDPNCLTPRGASGDETKEAGLVLDVINVPPALSQQTKSTPGRSVVYPGKVHLRVPFTADIAGNFLMHCHLLEHEDNGMMMGVQVWKQDAPTQTLSESAPMEMP